MYLYVYVYAGDKNGELSKVRFGIIKNENLVYDEGKDDNIIFEGMYIIYNYLR